MCRRTFATDMCLLAYNHRLQRCVIRLDVCYTEHIDSQHSPTGSWWNFRSRATALIAGFSNVTLRYSGSSSCSPNHHHGQCQLPLSVHRTDIERRTVSNLIHSLLLLPRQLAVLIDRLLLEEISNLVARSQKIVVPDMIVVPSGELRL